MGPSPKRILSVRGTPRERGRAVGEELRSVIGLHLEKRAQWIESTHRQSAQAFLARFLSMRRYLPVIELHAPGLLEEVRGIGEGACITETTALTLQLGDEISVYSDDASRHHQSSTGCSSFGALGEGSSGVILGQTMDLDAYNDEAQIVVRHEYIQGELEVVVLTVAGSLGKTGTSNAPVAVCCNSLHQLSSNPLGLPVDFVFRRMLEQPNASAAIEYAESVPHATGQNYVCADSVTLASIECSATSTSVGIPNKKGRLIHTNHPLWNQDLPEYASIGSVRRLESLAARVENDTPSLTLAEAKATLRAKDDAEFPICIEEPQRHAHGRETFTFGAVIYELSREVAMHVTLGPPSQSDFMELQLSQRRGA